MFEIYFKAETLELSLPGSVPDNPLDKPHLPPIKGEKDLEDQAEVLGRRPKTSNPNFRYVI